MLDKFELSDFFVVVVVLFVFGLVVVFVLGFVVLSVLFDGFGSGATAGAFTVIVHDDDTGTFFKSLPVT